MAVSIQGGTWTWTWVPQPEQVVPSIMTSGPPMDTLLLWWWWWWVVVLCCLSVLSMSGRRGGDVAGGGGVLGANKDDADSSDESSYPTEGDRAKNVDPEVRLVVLVLVLGRPVHADLRTLVVVELAVLTVEINNPPPGRYDNPASASCVAIALGRRGFCCR